MKAPFSQSIAATTARTHRTAGSPANRRLERAVKRAGTHPFNHEVQKHEMAKRIPQPRNGFERWAIRALGTEARSHACGSFLMGGAIAGGTTLFLGIFCLILDASASAFMAQWTTYSRIALGVAIAGSLALVAFWSACRYLDMLRTFSIVEWGRMDADPTSEALPLEAKKLIERLSYFCDEAGLTGYCFKVDYPLSLRIPDPILVIGLRGHDGELDEEYGVLWWE